MFLFFPPGVIFCLKLDFWKLLFYLLEKPVINSLFFVGCFCFSQFGVCVCGLNPQKLPQKYKKICQTVKKNQ